MSLLSNALPITARSLEGLTRADSAWACPGSSALTNLSPLCIIPTTLHLILPANATKGCVLSFPAPAFISNAGVADITPNTFLSFGVIVCVISFTPPKATTVPKSYIESASYLSAKSAYIDLVVKFPPVDFNKSSGTVK